MSLGLINVDNNTIFRKLCNFRLGEFNSECIFNYFPIFLCHGQKKRGNVNLKSAQKQLWSLQKKIHKQHLDRWRSKDMTWTDEWKNIYVIWTCTPMMSRPG